MRKKKQLRFGVKLEFPAKQDSFFDHMNGNAYFFGQEHTAESFTKGVNHEVIHFLIYGIKGFRASQNFDKICHDVEKWDKKAYYVLY